MFIEIRKNISSRTTLLLVTGILLSACASKDMLEVPQYGGHIKRDNYLDRCVSILYKYMGEVAFARCANKSLGDPVFEGSSSVPPLLGSPEASDSATAQPRLIRGTPFEGAICDNVFCGLNSIRVNVSSKPSGATVLVNEQFIGVTPISLGLSRSALNSIVVRERGFSDCTWSQPFIKEVSLLGGFEMLCVFEVVD